MRIQSRSPDFDACAGLLENGIKVLVYVGEYECVERSCRASASRLTTCPLCSWICNFIGNRRMVEALEWSGKEGFAGAELRSWSVADAHSGDAAGVTKSFAGLTYATIHKAGHMVSFSRPESGQSELTGRHPGTARQARRGARDAGEVVEREVSVALVIAAPQTQLGMRFAKESRQPSGGPSLRPRWRSAGSRSPSFRHRSLTESLLPSPARGARRTNQ